MLDTLFRPSRFNLSKVGVHSINPCRFGEDWPLGFGTSSGKKALAMTICCSRSRKLMADPGIRNVPVEDV
jgi:hypothetical protein